MNNNANNIDLHDSSIFLQDSSSIKIEPPENLKENITVFSAVEIGDCENGSFDSLKLSKHDSVGLFIEGETPFQSIHLVNTKYDNSDSIYSKHRLSLGGSKVIKKKQSYNSFSKVDSKRTKNIKEYISVNEHCASTVLENAQKLKKGKMNSNTSKKTKNIPVHSKSRSVGIEQCDTLNSENLALDCQSDDETIMSLPKKMFILISESLVKCTLCFKQIKLSSMKQHYKTHTGIKPFTCKFCQSRFTRKSDVQRHISSIHAHSRSTNLQCLVCEKKFVDEKSLSCHLKNHNKALYLVCHICGHKFKQRSYYENHLRFIHSLSNDIKDFDFYSQALNQKNKLKTYNNNRKATYAKDSNFKSSELNHFPGESSDEDGRNLSIHIKEEQIELSNNSFDSNDEEDVDSAVSSESKQCLSNQTIQIDSNISPSSSFLEKGTFSFTQNLMQLEADDEEELITKAIADHVSQSEYTLENIQSSTNPSLSSLSPCKEVNKNNEINFNGIDGIKNQPKSSEIHISATIDSKMQKFFLKIPNGRLIDTSTETGLDTLVSLVRELCSGKGELNGNIDVTIHHNIA